MAAMLSLKKKSCEKNGVKGKHTRFSISTEWIDVTADEEAKLRRSHECPSGNEKKRTRVNASSAVAALPRSFTRERGRRTLSRTHLLLSRQNAHAGEGARVLNMTLPSEKKNHFSSICLFQLMSPPPPGCQGPGVPPHCIITAESRGGKLMTGVFCDVFFLGGGQGRYQRSVEKTEENSWTFSCRVFPTKL